MSDLTKAGDTLVCISNLNRNMVLEVGKEYVVVETREKDGEFHMKFEAIHPELTEHIEPIVPIWVKWLDDEGNPRFEVKNSTGVKKPSKEEKILVKPYGLVKTLPPPQLTKLREMLLFYFSKKKFPIDKIKISCDMLGFVTVEDEKLVYMKQIHWLEFVMIFICEEFGNKPDQKRGIKRPLNVHFRTQLMNTFSDSVKDGKYWQMVDDTYDEFTLIRSMSDEK